MLQEDVPNQAQNTWPPPIIGRVTPAGPNGLGKNTPKRGLYIGCLSILFSGGMLMTGWLPMYMVFYCVCVMSLIGTTFSIIDTLKCLKSVNRKGSFVNAIGILCNLFSPIMLTVAGLLD